MKRKLLIISLGILIFSCFFAISAFAMVDYSEKAILADGTRLPVYDENQNPLIWYVSGVDENGKNVYKSVQNNCNEANGVNGDYVTYTINTSWMTQLENINIHIWNENLGEYEVFTEESFPVVVVNLRGLTSFEYINKGLKTGDIQYIYFNENLKDCCDYFKGSTSLRLVDLSECTNLSGGFGGVRNFYNCTNLHTIRFAPGPNYSLACSSYQNWRFSNTSMVEIVFPENITSLGVDNFKNNSRLESIYILGNTTSLGQRNFYGCTSLTNIYILGDNPTIDVTSFKENFYECVDGNTTYDFTGVGKYFFFVTTNSDYLNQVKEAIGATQIITYGDYVANPSSYTEGRYIISGTNICDVYYGEHNVTCEPSNKCVGACDVCGDIIVNHNDAENLSVSISYTSYDQAGVKTVKCNNPGCTYTETEEADALFNCLGYSSPQNGRQEMVIGFTVNNEAITEYINITGKTIKYGVFAVLKKNIENDDIFGNNGALADGIISAEISEYGFVAFELKIVGFTDEYKNAKLAMGAYVAAVSSEGVEYSYIQSAAPNENEKYFFASYNDVVGFFS